MRTLVAASAFRRDLKRCKKRRLDLIALSIGIDALMCDDSFPRRCRPHRLSGNFEGWWECHIGPDWLLIYDINDDPLQLRPTGSHSDLF
jgi:mRNA interferase YafQ